MKYLDLTLPDPALNLACDEALLDWADAGQGQELLRFWESHVPFVVVGYANAVDREVNLPACRKRGIPVLRRCTGGGTVVQGVGCLNYSLVLRAEESGSFGNISSANRCIMEKHRAALQPALNGSVSVQGHTDLALGARKFSGNAQRRKRHYLLFHGTFLLDFQLSLIEELLPLPSQQPGYRIGRSHSEFVQNLPLTSATVKELLRCTWNAAQPLTGYPAELTTSLAEQKYTRDDWNFRY